MSDAAAFRVALLAGVPDMRTLALIPQQIEFLKQIAPPESLVRGAYPFQTEACHATPPNIFAASVASARQYIASHVSQTYAAQLRRNLTRLLRAHETPLVLITGSCGLAMARAGLSGVQRASRVHILAFGPAGCAPDNVARFQAVQRTRDGWSRWFYRGPQATRIDAGHLEYWVAPEAQRIARAFVETVV